VYTHLRKEHVDSFKENGVVVIPNVLTEVEVTMAITKLEESLKNKGCDATSLETTAKSLHKLSSTYGSGGILDIFYEDWKLKLNEHPAVVSSIQTLWRETYCTYSADNIDEDINDFSHPYGNFDPSEGYMYIDRVCYRVPSIISSQFGESKKKQLQRSLTPHLDCCPHNMYGNDSKWRPIQAFICLTDTLLPEQGGFEACLGHHKSFVQWAAGRTGGKHGQSAPCVGDFTPIRPVEDRDVINRMQHIPCKAGDLVCWDYRIPHANSRFNHTDHARAVVYIGLLPAVPVNARYAECQLSRYRSGQVPTDQWHESSDPQPCEYQFSELGQRLMGMIPWHNP